MINYNTLIQKLQKFGVGRRSLEDELFGADRVPARLGIYDEDEEDSCHQVVTSACPMAGCTFTGSSLLDAERHYDTAHRYRCSACRRALPSPHLLHLHLQETHDSFFAAMAARKASYCCYIQECTNKFINAEERWEHCIKVHKLPKDFRFEIKPKGTETTKKSTSENATFSMDVDVTTTIKCCQEPRKLLFHNNKQRGLIKYSGKKFTSDKTKTSSRMTNMYEFMSDLKQNLPP